MPLSRLLYTSDACIRDSDAPAIIQVHEMAHASSRRNAASQLTGALLFVENQFIQVLEGDPEAIEQTFEKICCDLRHTNVKLVDLASVSERMFPEWEMKVLSEMQETSLALRDDLQHIRFLVGVNARVAVEQMRKCIDAQHLGERSLEETPAT
ncbi:MAG: BLUF domain-containing protein [Alteraurantiacibacter sp.]